MGVVYFMNDFEYEKIRKRIENANKFTRFYVIPGPKGDVGEKGDSGVANITVGTTETVSSMSSAEVINVGTSDNVILNFKIPRGKDGEKGAPGKDGEKGEQGHQGIPGEKGDKGDIGISEGIVIDSTETIESNLDASVVDNFSDNIHHLSFYIPKGEKGNTGAGAGASSYNLVFYASFVDATDSRAMTIKEKTFLPDSSSMITVPSVINIDINVTGIYEITLCGKISGVSADNGGSFYLMNITTGTVINNLNFSLNEGDVTDMTFSGTTITQIFAPATFQVKSMISNDLGTSSVKVYDVCLIIKRYNV